LFVYRSFFGRNTFVRQKTTRISVWPKKFRANQHRHWEKWREKTGAVIIASLFERRSAGVYHNTAAIIDANGKLLGKYRKMHIPDDPLYHEKFYFAPGDLGFKRGRQRRARSASAFAGTNGIRKRRA